jgi:hypothetical protein
MLEIIAGIHNDGEVRANQAFETEREFGAADAAA